MKKATEIILIMLCMAVTCGAQNSSIGDTVRTIISPSAVTILERDNGVTVNVTGIDNDTTYYYTYTSDHSPNAKVKTSQNDSRLDWNVNLPFQKSDTSSTTSRRHMLEIITAGLYGGWGYNSVDKSFPSFHDNLGHEYEMGILQFAAICYHPWKGMRLSFGLGLDWRRYHMRNFDLTKDENGMATTVDFPENAVRHNANINIFSLQFPLMLRQRVKGDFAVWGGGIMNVNTGAHFESDYRVADRDFHISTRDIHHRKVTFGLMAGVSLDFIGWYVRWRPQELFKSGYGPKLSTVSTGVMLMF